MVRIAVVFSPDGIGKHWYSLFIEGATDKEVTDELCFLQRSLPQQTFFRVSRMFPDISESAEVN